MSNQPKGVVPKGDQSIGERVMKLLHSKWTLSTVLAAASGLEISYAALTSGPLATKWQYLGLLLVVGILGLASIVQAWRSTKATYPQDSGSSQPSNNKRPSWVVWVGLAILMLAFPFLLMGPWGAYFEFFSFRLLTFWLFTVIGGYLWRQSYPAHAIWKTQAAIAISMGVIYQVAIHLPLVSTYPLAMGWSETSRFYYASLFVAKQLYGLKAALSVLHPSRYLLQAVPFFFNIDSLWIHRAWQMLLWLGLSWLTGWALSRRLNFDTRWLSNLIVLWAILFLFQGPIIYHLLVPVVIIFLGHDSKRPLRSLLVVFLASAWAGISRINWIPVPAFLATTLYFLEVRVGERSMVEYLRWPFLWGLIGAVTALSSQSAYMALSGNSLSQFGSSLSSDLLWYRLLPNPTFPPGILLATLLASAPIAWVIWTTRDKWHKTQPIRWFGIVAMLAVLGLGGVIVSLKIGGGSNLHNLDAYLIMLLVVGTYLFAGPIDGAGFRSSSLDPLPKRVLALAIAIPVLFTVSNGGRYLPPDISSGEQIVGEIQRQIDKLPADPRVLFIGERHLLTFDQVEGVELISRYERVFLMEMAMGNTEPYLSQFRSDLADQSFDLIVSDPLKVQFQGRGIAFGEENDTWVQSVSIPVLCYYEPVKTYLERDIQILAPREQIPQCPNVDS